MRAWAVAGVLTAILMAGCAAATPAPTRATLEVGAGPTKPSVEAPTPAPASPASAVPRADDAQRAELLAAKASFEAFLARADDKPEYAAAVMRAKERVDDIDRMLVFMAGTGAATPQAPPKP